MNTMPKSWLHARSDGKSGSYRSTRRSSCLWLSMKFESETDRFDTHVDWVAVNGRMEVRDNVVSIVADSAERDRDIVFSRAETCLTACRKANRRSKTNWKISTNYDVRLLLCIVQSIESMCQNIPKRRPVVFAFYLKNVLKSF